MQSKVMIIGAGLTGLLAAIELRKLGYDAEIMEQAPQLRYEGGGLGIWPPGVAMLQALGLKTEIKNLSGQFEEIPFGTIQGNKISTLPLSIFEGINGERNIFVVRKELQDLLARQIPEEKIIFNKKCLRVSHHHNHVQAHFSDGTNKTADFLIAADGIFSKVRKSLGIEANLQYRDLIVVGGIINHVPAWKPACQFLLGINKLIMIMPVSGNRYYVFMCRPLAHEKIEKIKNDPQQQLALFSNVSPELDNVIGALQAALADKKLNHHYFFQPIYDADPMPQWSQERVVLLGEAAHPIGPQMGLGASFCFQGVMSLIDGLKKYPHDLSRAFAYYQTIQSARLHHLLPFERLDEANVLNPDPIAFSQRLEQLGNTAPQELFASLIKALSYTDEELLHFNSQFIA